MFAFAPAGWHSGFGGFLYQAELYHLHSDMIQICSTDATSYISELLNASITILESKHLVLSLNVEVHYCATNFIALGDNRNLCIRSSSTRYFSMKWSLETFVQYNIRLPSISNTPSNHFQRFVPLW